MADEAREITPPVVFYKGDGPTADKDFAIRQVPADLVEVEVDDDPKDSSAIESAPFLEPELLATEVALAPVEKAPALTTTEDSKPTSSTPPTTLPGKPAPSVTVPTPSSGSPSAEK